jgi:hypothetical protein
MKNIKSLPQISVIGFDEDSNGLVLIFPSGLVRGVGEFGFCLSAGGFSVNSVDINGIAYGGYAYYNLDDMEDWDIMRKFNFRTPGWGELSASAKKKCVEIYRAIVSFLASCDEYAEMVAKFVRKDTDVFIKDTAEEIEKAEATIRLLKTKMEKLTEHNLDGATLDAASLSVFRMLVADGMTEQEALAAASCVRVGA